MARGTKPETGSRFAVAANQGVNLSDSEYIVFLDDGTEVTTGWLEALLDEFGTANITGTPCGIALPTDAETNRNETNTVDENHENMSPQRIDLQDETDWAAKRFGISSACMLVGRDVIKKLGGLDEESTARQSAVDFCARAMNAGFRISICTSSIVRSYNPMEKGAQSNGKVDLDLVHGVTVKTQLELVTKDSSHKK